MHLGEIGRLVSGKDLRGDGSIVHVASVECLVGRWGADGGCDAEGGAVGEGGRAGEVEAVDAALVAWWWIHGSYSLQSSLGMYLYDVYWSYSSSLLL